MSVATVPGNGVANVSDYVRAIVKSDPDKAVEIALAEVRRQEELTRRRAEEYRIAAEVKFDGSGSIVEASYAGMLMLARQYGDSTIVPEHYRGKPADCFVAVQNAMLLRVNPLQYMQQTFVYKGKVGVQAQLVTALLNRSGLIVGRIHYEHAKDGKSCTAFVFDKASGERIEETITWETVVGEGWLGKDGSKWKTMPRQMFQYRAAAWLIRQHYPEVILGQQTADEVEDSAVDELPEPRPLPRTLDALTTRLQETAKQPEPVAAEAEPLGPQEYQPDPAEECAAFIRRIEAAKTGDEVGHIWNEANRMADILGPVLTAEIQAARKQRVMELQRGKS